MSLILTAPWLWARDEFKKARSKEQGKKLSGNTWLVVSRVSPTPEWRTDETVYACEFHGTEVVRYYPNDMVAASLNGWSTVTTKVRVNQFSPMSIGSDRGLIVANTRSSGGSQRWVGGEYTWFYWKDGKFIFKDGGMVPNLVTSRRKDSMPKGRDPLTRPLSGDAFEDREGMWVLAPDIVNFPRRLKLFAYFGDHESDRALCVTDDTPARDMPSVLELLAGSQGGGLKPIDRFVWSQPKGKSA